MRRPIGRVMTRPYDCICSPHRQELRRNSPEALIQASFKHQQSSSLRQLQRRLAQGCQLLAQLQDLFAPVTDRVEPWEGAGEDRIFPAPGKPGAVVEHPQGTQGADQLELAGIEVAELVVAFD